MKRFLLVCLSTFAVLLGAVGFIMLLIGAIDNRVLLWVAGAIAILVGVSLFAATPQESDERRQWRKRLKEWGEQDGYPY